MEYDELEVGTIYLEAHGDHWFVKCDDNVVDIPSAVILPHDIGAINGVHPTAPRYKLKDIEKVLEKLYGR